MRVEIVQELDADDNRLEIPWSSPTDPRLQYFDLKSCPDRIDQLEECRQYPPLAGLLRRINAPGSIFRSAKCDVWATTDLAADERLDFNLPFKMGSYVDLVFDRPDIRWALEPHVQLGGKLGQILRRLRVQAQMEIALRRCLVRPEECWGYCFTIFIHAYGASVGEAEDEWARAVGALGDALAGMDEIFRRTPRAAGWASQSP